MRRVATALVPLALLGALLASAGSPASAAPPGNDDLSGATEIELGIELLYDLTEATADGTGGACPTPAHDIWYEFTAPAAGEYTAYTVGGTTIIDLAWFTDADNELLCGSNTVEGGGEMATRTFANGETAYIRINGIRVPDAIGQGSGTVGVMRSVAAGDDFDSPMPLLRATGAPTALVAAEIPTTFTLETGEPEGCGTTDGSSWTDHTAWFTFTPDVSRTWLIQTVSRSGDFTVDLAMYTGDSLDDLTLVGCSDDSAMAVSLTAGTTYAIQVGPDSDTGTVVVRAEAHDVRGAVERLGVTADDNLSTAGTDLIFDQDGNPFITYRDFTADELWYARRDGDGAWTAGSVADGGVGAAIAQLADGAFAIAHEDGNDLMVTTGTPGAWTTTVVDDGSAIGGSGATSVGDTPSIVDLGDGDIAVVHVGGQYQLRLAARIDGTWTRHIVFDDGDDISIEPQSMVLLPDGTLAIVMDHSIDHEARVYVNDTVGDYDAWTGTLVVEDADNEDLGAQIVRGPDDSVWIAVFMDTAYGFTVHELQGDDSWLTHRPGGLELDAADAWTRSDMAGVAVNDDGDLAIGLRGDPAGVLTFDGSTWSFLEANSFKPGIDEAGFDGGADSGGSFALRPDGRMAFAGNAADPTTGDDVLTFLEDGLLADAGDDIAGDTARGASLDGSDSADSWGAIASYAWTGPVGCTFATPAAATTTVDCDVTGDQELTLTITDLDGWTHSDSMTFTVADTHVDDVFVCDDEATTPFIDMPGNWADAPIACLFDLEVTNGTSGTTYSPLANVTRVQMAAFMERLYEAMTGQACPVVATPFTDLPGTSWGDDAIACIYGLGVTTGTSGTTFSPADDVTRVQMAAFITRLWEAVREYEAAIVATPFLDLPGVSWADDAIARLYGLGITEGTSGTTYSPGEFVSRMQMAAFLARFYEAVPDFS